MRAKVTFGQAGADWVAYYKGKIIAEVPMKKRQEQPPRWFRDTARTYARAMRKLKVI